MDKKVLVKFWKLLASKSDCNRIVLPHCLMFTIATVTNASYISIFKKHLSWKLTCTYLYCMRLTAAPFPCLRHVKVVLPFFFLLLLYSALAEVCDLRVLLFENVTEVRFWRHRVHCLCCQRVKALYMLQVKQISRAVFTIFTTSVIVNRSHHIAKAAYIYISTRDIYSRPSWCSMTVFLL